MTTTAPWLTVAQIADVMNVSKMTVYRLVHDGSLTAFHVGRQMRVRPQDFERYLHSIRSGWDL
jgi:excisionase family DNA binding protein